MKDNKRLVIDWNKFKGDITGRNVQKSKYGYIEFCKMLDETDFELVSDYVESKEKVELIYKLDSNIKLNIKPSIFKIRTYKTIIDFKNNLIKNGDEFIKFTGLSNRNSLIAKIKTFDNGEINIDIGAYSKFIKGRQDFYSKLKEVNGSITDYYKDNNTKISIYIDEVKLNSMSSNIFKTYTYKSIINFKNELKKNNDKFIKFIGLTNRGTLIVEILTFDNEKVSIDISQYNAFNKSRQDTYSYCEENGYELLSPYVGATEKVLIDFNCGHSPNWITPASLKENKGCPVCNESKGEKAIREYLENNNVNFIQECRFDNCRYKNHYHLTSTYLVKTYV